MSESEAVAVRMRPHWLPTEAWLGIITGEWPLHAFTKAEHAAHWAAEDARRRRVWRVEIPDDTETFSGAVVPARHELRPAP